jgi:hypothetical protein
MDRRLALAVFRAAVAIIVLVAIGYQVKIIVDSGLFRPLRFFAFFTILSNLFGAFLWLWLAARWRQPRTRTDDLLRGAATLYLVVTFVVVVLLLRGAELSLSDQLVDFIVHKLFPILVVVDWLIDPPETDLRMPDVALWLIFPLVWVTFTLIRGAVDDWYPYPFLDPDNGGYRSGAAPPGRSSPSGTSAAIGGSGKPGRAPASQAIRHAGAAASPNPADARSSWVTSGSGAGWTTGSSRSRRRSATP